MGSVVRVSRVIHAAAPQVWEVITDLEHAADVLSGVVGVEVLTAGAYREGTRWRETRKIMGKEATEEMWVSDVDAPHRTVVSAASAGVVYTTVITLAEAGEATELTMEFSSEAPPQNGLRKALHAVMAPLGSAVTKKMLEKDLDDIARAAERS
ncbi:SRPBCC family protein [Hoyosella subflava]|uniref:SRPBCC family protein n=1 Tax=Hoyosella subflava TaxID=639313 RepID=UPI00059EB1DA|nr:SRPBCC family protein [Hoyosella subflava]